MLQKSPLAAALLQNAAARGDFVPKRKLRASFIRRLGRKEKAGSITPKQNNSTRI
jgi:hypothetical protein